MPRSWRLEIVTPNQALAIDQSGRPHTDHWTEIGPFFNPTRVTKVHAALLRQLFGIFRARFYLGEIPPRLLVKTTAQPGFFIEDELPPELVFTGHDDRRDFNLSLMAITRDFLEGRSEWPEIDPAFDGRWAENLWRTDQKVLAEAFQGLLGDRDR